ncbi:MAG: hypothetical protein WCA29_07080 [Jiangellales bacterium]
MSTTPAPVAERPTSVTVALAIGWISVALGVVEGIALLVLAGDETVTAALGVEEGVARTVAIIVLVVSAILAVVVYLLSKGSNVSRMLVTIVMFLRMGVAVWAIVAFGTHQLTEAIVSIGIAVTAIALLWNDKANAFFATNNP